MLRASIVQDFFHIQDMTVAEEDVENEPKINKGYNNFECSSFSIFSIFNNFEFVVWISSCKQTAWFPI